MVVPPTVVISKLNSVNILDVHVVLPILVDEIQGEDSIDEEGVVTSVSDEVIDPPTYVRVVSPITSSIRV